MIIDSSAIVAIAFNEPERVTLVNALAAADRVRVSAATWVETSLVLGGSSLNDSDNYRAGFARDFDVEFIAFTREHADAAVEAWKRFGKGKHPARLNLGDCMSYATAKLANEPLLFVGDDFAKTDIQSALSVG